MNNHRLSAKEWGERIVLAVAFVGVGVLIYLVFSPMRPLLFKTVDYLGRIGLIAILLVTVLLARRSVRFEKYGQMLALAWGYVTQKTDSLWGAILFHAGMDIPIMLGIFSNLP